MTRISSKIYHPHASALQLYFQELTRSPTASVREESMNSSYMGWAPVRNKLAHATDGLNQEDVTMEDVVPDALTDSEEEEGDKQQGVG